MMGLPGDSNLRGLLSSFPKLQPFASSKTRQHSNNKRLDRKKRDRINKRAKFSRRRNR